MEQTIGRKSRVVSLIIVFVLLASSIALAIDSRITASNHTYHTKVITATEANNHTYWTKGYYKGYASGYTTSTTRHYTNVKLYFVGSDVKSSGRKWGTGKVSAKTSYWTGGCSIVPEAYGSAVYYGF